MASPYADAAAAGWRYAASEAASSAALFERHVPVALRAGDKEERVEELTVRIVLGVSKHLHNSKARRLLLAAPPAAARPAPRACLRAAGAPGRAKRPREGAAPRLPRESQGDLRRRERGPSTCRAPRLFPAARIGAGAARAADERGGPVLPAHDGGKRGGFSDTQGGAGHPGGLRHLPRQAHRAAARLRALPRRGGAAARAPTPPPRAPPPSKFRRPCSSLLSLPPRAPRPPRRAASRPCCAPAARAPRTRS